VLHLCIEEPYFQFRAAPTTERPVSHHVYRGAVLLFLAFILITFVTKYMGDFNFFSVLTPYTRTMTEPAASSVPYALSERPLVFTFQAYENNMGVITLHITHTGIPLLMSQREDKDVKGQQTVWVGLRERGATGWYATQETSTVEVGTSDSYPFGFPPIPNSLGKKYELQVQLKNHSSLVTLTTEPVVFTTVSSLDKKTVLSHPHELQSLLVSKTYAFVDNAEARIVGIMLVPFLILYTILAI
jgi:hypothetical protein